MEAASPLAAWETFFFLIGSSAAALTGLQFVVMALIAESGRRTTHREIEAFSTPTILHFTAVLLVSAILSAPWHGLLPVAIILGVCGIAGVAYIFLIIRRARRLSTYRLVGEDWRWHVVFPLISYVLLLVSAILLPGQAHRVLFGIGASALLLLFIGLHNAWDTVTYITIDLPAGRREPEPGVDDSLSPPKPITKSGRHRGRK
ncbi:MAG TPA: hypothetical protein VE977_03325 [Pyrinomonadaceae bacterium]|nr:hypothetical protein [Pyrinomonadaceae bacterium]